MSRLRKLISEVHRRSLWQVLTVYLVGAAVGYQLIGECLWEPDVVVHPLMWCSGSPTPRRQGRVEWA